MANTALPACAQCLIAVLVAGVGSAQYQGSFQKATGSGGLTEQFIKTGLYVISGGGDNSVLRLSANGLILVNGKLAGNYDALVKVAKRISDQPIRALIITNYLENHTGNNAKFLAAHTVIIAQENVKGDLAKDNLPNVRAVPPDFTYAREYMLRLDGITVELLHFGNAVTNGDTVVYFPNLKVVAVGDLYTPIPRPDFAAGGSLVGWGPVLAQVLKLDFELAVPGTGPAVTRPELEAFKVKIDILVARASSLVKKGVPKNRLMAELKTDDLGWRLDFSGRQLDAFYDELKTK